MTEQEIVALANTLATELARVDGYEWPDGHLLFIDPHPRAQRYWDRAAIAFEQLHGTDINDTLTNLGIERPDPAGARLFTAARKRSKQG